MITGRRTANARRCVPDMGLLGGGRGWMCRRGRLRRPWGSRGGGEGGRGGRGNCEGTFRKSIPFLKTKRVSKKAPEQIRSHLRDRHPPPRLECRILVFGHFYLFWARVYPCTVPAPNKPPRAGGPGGAAPRETVGYYFHWGGCGPDWGIAPKVSIYQNRV